MTRRPRPAPAALLAAAALTAAAGLLSACSPAGTEVAAPDGFSADPDGTVIQPSASAAAPAASYGVPVPASQVPSGQAADGVPNAVNPDTVTVDGASGTAFSAKELKRAYLWATAFTRDRFSRPGFFTWPEQASAFGPAAYYGFTDSMTDPTRDQVQEWLIGQDAVAAHRDRLLALAPLPPRIDGGWAAPPVGDFAFGKARFAPGPALPDGTPTVAVTFDYTAAGMYVAGKTWWAVPVTDTVTWTLAQGPDDTHPWLLHDWSSATRFGDPVALASAPLDRVPQPKPAKQDTRPVEIPQEIIDGATPGQGIPPPG